MRRDINDGISPVRGFGRAAFRPEVGTAWNVGFPAATSRWFATHFGRYLEHHSADSADAMDLIGYKKILVIWNLEHGLQFF